MPRSGKGWCPFAEQIEGAIGFEVGSDLRVGFCDHTAGGFYSTLRRASFWNDPNGDGSGLDAVSVHFAISRAGDVCQIINIFDKAFAQGRLSAPVTWPPYAVMNQANPNNYLISTEHEDKIRVNGESQSVPGSEWTPEQYAADLRVKRWCVDEVKRQTGQDILRFGVDSLAGHHMFDHVDRPNCPGRFWRDIYQTRLYRDLTEDEMFVRYNHGVADISLVAPLPGPYDIRNAFSLPPEARRVRLQGWAAGGEVEVYDGTPDVNNRDAGRLFPPYGTVDVILSADGKASFIAGQNATALKVACLGYWT